jgi:hypothetical protein
MTELFWAVVSYVNYYNNVGCGKRSTFLIIIIEHKHYSIEMVFTGKITLTVLL